MVKRAICLGLFRPREVILPTAKAWLILFGFLTLSGYALVMRIHPFLSPIQPIPSDILVVEGWIPEYSQREALDLFRSGGYGLLITTGGPLPPGLPFSELGTYAQLAATVLMGMGLGSDSIIAVPSVYASRDRTFMEGLALKKWRDSTQATFRSLNIVTFSAHGRRSHYLFQKALGKDVEVGVISTRDLGYDPKRWWKFSDGVRRILGESIAYLYAVLIFRA
jgi:hypothetical protein